MSQNPTQSRIYLDYNATTPVHPSVKEKLGEWLEVFGNPSSVHGHGREAKKILREARQVFADAIGANPMEIIFTSGGSEANSTIIKGLLHSIHARDRREIIVSPVEHPSVLETMSYAHAQGFTLHFLKISADGEVDMEHYESLLSDKTLLVSVMLANNETGHIFPIKKIAQRAKEVGAFVHIDAVQALGRIPLNVQHLGVDFATFSGHKLYALKGAGAYFARRGISFPSLIEGGGQERGRRAGTENTLAIASLGHMVQFLKNADLSHLETLRNHLEARVMAEISDVKIVGRKGKRLMNTSNLIVQGVHGESLLMSLDLKGFSVSTSSACSSGNQEPSHVLMAMGYSIQEAQSSLRVSVGNMTTLAEVDQFVDVLKVAVTHLRSLTSYKPAVAEEENHVRS